MTGKQCGWITVSFLLLAGIAGPATGAEQRGMGRLPRPGIGDDPIPARDRSLSRKMLKASYEQLQKDVQHLSELADELKEEVTTTDDEDVLSLTGVKKAEEIEKLAKKVQSRM